MDFLKYEKVSLENKEYIFNEIKEFLPYYLFNDKISTSFNNIKNLFDLSDKDFYDLKIVHFFLSKEMEDFITCLPKLLRNLSHTSTSDKNIFKNNIRGKIEWNSTIKTRLSIGSMENNIFVCSTSSKIYDLEENQLLKFILKKIIFLFKKIKFARIKNIDFNEFEENDKSYNKINRFFYKCEKSINKIYFDEISDVKHIYFKHKLKCIKNRNPFYFTVYNLYKLYENLFLYNEKNTLLDLVNTRLIKVTNPDKLYEIYVFFKLVSIVPEWNINLMHKKNEYYVHGSLFDGVNITIFYQKTPEKLKDVSKYLEVLDNYKYISGNVRSPDIIIEFEKNGKFYYRIVEIKNVSESYYLHDGLYKVMGYYYDFKDILTDKYPVVLICWKGSVANEKYDIFKNDKYIILDYGTFNENLEKLIEFKE